MKNCKFKNFDSTKIFIENEQSAVEVNDELAGLLEKTVMTCLQNENVSLGCEINILLTDDDSIRQINKQFRNIDTPTDVLSFPMADVKEGRVLAKERDCDPDEGLLLLGDIVISMETAKRQAEMYGHSFEREIAFLAAHGAYHLLGYDHLVEKEEKIMISKQEAVLEKLGLKRT